MKFDLNIKIEQDELQIHIYLINKRYYGVYLANLADKH